MAAGGGDPKKKRRQNVACDSCKLRRVKCDLTELLTPSSSIQASSSHVTLPSPPPLHVLIRANPGVECTNCRNKKVKCTTEQILNPARPNKGGRRIEEAKKRFGGEELNPIPATNADLQAAYQVENRHGDTPMDMGGWAALTRTDGPDQSGVGMSVPDLSMFMDNTNFDFERHSWDSMPINTINGLANSDQTPASTSYLPVQPLPHTQSSHYAPALPLPSRSPASNPSPSAQSGQALAFDPLNAYGARLRGKDREAAAVWDQVTQQNIPSSLIPPVQTHEAGPSFRSSDWSSLVEHIPNNRHMANIDPDVEFDALMMSFVPKSSPATSSTTPATSTYTSNHASTPQTPNQPVSLYFGSDWRPSLEKAIAGKKRSRIEISPAPDEDDAWNLWEEEEEDEAAKRRMVKWGRREAVQQKLADRALGRELSKHLVKSFFHCVHPSFPALSPEGFYMEWERAGERSDRMSPTQETLCAVMEAWGSRYSDLPVVLGLPPNKAALAPKVIQPNGTLAPGSQARAHWGRARLNVCNALVDRARKLLDINGIMRTPSVTGLQALILYNQLLNLTDQRSRAADQYMENQLTNAVIVEQMKLLRLNWESTGDIPTDTRELQVTPGQMRMKQRRIFWTVVISDAFNAAASGDLPKIPDEELEAVARWISDVEAKLPMSTFKTLAFFLSCYHRIALVARTVARHITKPNKRPGSVVLDEFMTIYKICLAQVKAIHKDIIVVTAEMLLSCEESLIGFSPLNYIINLRMSCPFLFLIMHQALREQLEFRRNLKESFIFDDSASSIGSTSQGPSPPGPETDRLSLLEELHLQSVDMLLDNCRSQVYMYQTILPTGMVQAAAIFLRVLIASVQFMAEVPSVEQGYPENTLGGLGWTWETKQKEVNVCIEALYQLGWAWADVSDVLESVVLAMERMTPTKEQLAGYQTTRRVHDQRIALAKEVDASNDRLLFARAMGFWPPQSVPDVIENAMKNLQIGDRDSIDRSNQAIPWKELAEINANISSERKEPTSSLNSTTSPDVTMMMHRAEQTPLTKSLAQMGKVDHDLATAADVPFPGLTRNNNGLSHVLPNSGTWVTPVDPSPVGSEQARSKEVDWFPLNTPTESPSCPSKTFNPPAQNPSDSNWSSGLMDSNDMSDLWDFQNNTWIDFDRLTNDLTAVNGHVGSANTLWDTTPSTIEELLQHMAETGQSST